MYIHEAIQKAQIAPSVITRHGFGDRCYLVVSSNPRECIYVGAEGLLKLGYGWEPTAEDLISNDWEVTRVEGLEWPETAPTNIQRSWKRFLNQGSGRK